MLLGGGDLLFGRLAEGQFGTLVEPHKQPVASPDQFPTRSLKTPAALAI